MKRYILILAALVTAAACVEKAPSDQEILDSRASESSTLEVSYAAGGAAVKSLSFTHASSRIEIDVNVNNDNLRWNLESDRSWCMVVPGEHRGPGKVTLDIAANETFDAREPATLTFVAGEFRGFRIGVDQSASAFILSQPFFLSPLSGDSYAVKVTTLPGTSWSFSGNDWLSVQKGETVSNDGYDTTTLTITSSANEGNSRYGSVTLSSGEEKDGIWFYQFGKDLTYDKDGNIVFPGSGEASLSFTTPAYVVSSVEGPAFTHSEITDNGDGTATVTIQMDSNLSDCAEFRPVELSLILSNASASIVSLPSMMQDYVPAHGLVTGKGLIAFAKAVSEGTSTADWEENGVVIVKQDIDMAGISDWEGIGTAAKPFKGKFDGDGHSVTNLKNSAAGIFGYVKDATIQRISLGKGCSLYYNNAEYMGKEGCFGGIVSVAEGSTISACSVSGDLEFSGNSDNEDPSYVGGVVGWADKSSTIEQAKMAGKLTISSPSSSGIVCYAGGIAGLCLGKLTASEMTGRISFSSGVGTIFAGGIQGALPAGADVSNNSFMGTLTLGGNSAQVFLGGLYGSILSDRSFDSASDKSVSLGNINIDSFLSGTGSMVYAGGFAGKAEPGISLSFKDYEFQTNIALDQTANRQASFVCLGGVLGGCDPDAPCKSVRFESVSNMGFYSTAYSTSVGSQISREFVGGIAGFVNGPATFTSCTNNGEIGRLTADANCANTKNYVIVLGGIAGVTMGGDASFTSCENKGYVTNKHYSNCIPENTREGWYTPCTAAGILGAFDFKPDSSGGRLTMTNCMNGSMIVSYRGMAAGIVGFARNASITSCTNLGDLGQNSTNSSNAAYKGGIACWLSNSAIVDCVAKCNVFCSNPASAVQSPGGILSLSTDGGVSITGSSFFGVLSVNKGDQPFACGGIVSTAEEDTKVKDCKYGGRVNGIDISENNVSSYAIGNGMGSANGISIWNGTI